MKTSIIVPHLAFRRWENIDSYTNLRKNCLTNLHIYTSFFFFFYILSKVFYSQRKRLRFSIIDFSIFLSFIFFIFTSNQITHSIRIHTNCNLFINSQSISTIIRGNYIFCSRERISSERRVGGSTSDRARDTCVGDRDPGGSWRVVEHMPIRMHSGGPLLSGYRTNVNHHCRGELHSFVSASRKVRARKLVFIIDDEPLPLINFNDV